METQLIKQYHGGSRAGSGRPKGAKNLRTMEREITLGEVQDKIAQKAFKLTETMMTVALGKVYVYKIVSGKHTLVIDEKELERAYDNLSTAGMSSDGQYRFITVKEPNTKAIHALLDRAFGKSKQTADLEITSTFSLSALAERRRLL
jgi:hypothetical protein